MRYAGHINYKISQNPRGGWLAQSKCPAEGCGAAATATSASELGPYDGSCTRGHGIHVPYVTRSSTN
jgi:hypothetical protein